MAYRSEMEIGVNQRRIQSDIVSGVKRGAQMASPAVIRVQIPTMDFKKFSAPLGRITGDLNQFQGALDASIARTLAFGASASVLAGVGAALRGIVQAGIEVEAAMAGINSILQLSSSGLAKFSGDMFDVARNTAQSFKDVSTAALELSRTGLNAEDTLKRLNGAMMLSRLTGMDSAVAVKALTAAVNGFSKEGITDIEIVNRLANVETKYAVSARDLADAVSRSGAVAQDAGVSFNELISIVTSVQQQTARGGAVIGNGFKSIFTRIQRAGVREELERIGVATSDSAGAFRGAIPILQDYARVYQTLSDAEKSSTAEKIAGVFQINTLKAALNDLNKEYSVYGGALDVANSTTDEAIQRNEQLNQTTAALLANTTTSLKEFGAALSGLAAEEGLRNVLNIVNTVAKKMADLMDEEQGSSIAKAIMGGMGKFIAGPGLLMIGKTFFNLLKFLGGQTITVLKQLSTLSVEKEKQQKIEQAIGAALKNNEMAVNKIIGAEGNRVVQEQIILGVIKEQQVAMKQLQAVQAAISRSAASGMFAVGAGGMATTKPKKASGYVPNFAASAGDVISERIAANNAGYEAGRVYNTRIHDGSGGSFQATVNDREKIQTVIGPNGNKGTYVIPPTVGRGFIPNFGLNAKIGSAIRMGKMTLAEAQAKYPSYIPSSEKISKNKPIETSVAGKLGMIVSQKLPIGEVTGRTFKDGQEYRIKFQRAGFNLPIRPENVDLEKNVVDNLARFTNGYMSKLFPKGDFQKVKSKSDFTNIGSINSFIGTAFETAVKRGTGGNTKVRDTDPSRIIDFPTPSDKMRRLFHGMPGMYEAKWADNSALRNDVARKAIDSGLVAGVGGTEKGIREISKIKGRKNKASGFIPNFAAVPTKGKDKFFSGRNRTQIAWIQSYVKKHGLPPEMVADPFVMKRLGTLFAKKYGGQGFGAEQGMLGFGGGYVPNFAAQTVFQKARKGGMNRGAMTGRAFQQTEAEIQKLKTQVYMGASDPTLQAIMTTVLSLIKQDGEINPAEVKAWSDTINFLKAKARNFVANKFPQRLAPTSPKGKIMAGGYAPKFVDQIQKTMAFEKQVSGQRPIFDTKPFPHVRNASQPTFQSAMNDHGGLRNALRDSSFGQKSAGLASGYVPNFGGTFSGANVGEQITLAAKKAGVSFNDNSVAVKANSGAIKQSTVGVKQMATSSVQAKTAFQRATGGISDFVKRARASLFGMPGGKGRNLLGAGGPAAGQKGSGMGAMGAYFAAQSVASYAEQSGGRTGAIGGAVASGLNVGFMASMVGLPPLAAGAAGALWGLGKAIYNLNDKTKEYEESATKAADELSKTRDWGQRYAEALSGLESAKINQSASEIKRLNEEISNLAKEVPESLVSVLSLSNSEAAQNAISKIAKEQEREVARTRAVGALGKLDTFMLSPDAKDKDFASSAVKTYLASNKDVFEKIRGGALNANWAESGFDKDFLKRELPDLFAVFDDAEWSDIHDIVGAIVDGSSKLEEIEKNIKSANKNNDAFLRVLTETRRLTREKRIETEESAKKREAESFALEIGKIIQSNRRSMIENSSTGGFLSSYEAQTQMQAIDVSEMQIGMKEKASQILNNLEDAFREAKFAEVKPEEAGNLKFLSDAMATFGKNFENLNRGGVIDTSALEAQINLMSFYINKMKEDGQSIENTTASGLEKNKAILEKALAEAKSLNRETQKQTIIQQLAAKNAVIRKNLEAAMALSKGPVAENKDILTLSKSITDVFSGMVMNKEELTKITGKLDEVVGKMGDGTSGIFGTVGSTSKGTQQIGENVFAGLKIFEGIVGRNQLPTEKIIQGKSRRTEAGKEIIQGDITAPLSRNERLLQAANFLKKNYEKYESIILDATIRVAQGSEKASDIFLNSFAKFAANAPDAIKQQVSEMSDQEYVLKEARYRRTNDRNKQNTSLYFRTRGLSESEAAHVRKTEYKPIRTIQQYVDEVRSEMSNKKSLAMLGETMTEMEARGKGGDFESAVEAVVGNQIISMEEIMKKISQADISSPLANLKGKSEQEVSSSISGLSSGQMKMLGLDGVTKQQAMAEVRKRPEDLLKNLGSDETNNNLVTIISRTESIIEAINNLTEALTKDSVAGEGSQVSNEFNIGVDVSANDQRWQEVAKKLAESIKELAERSVQDGYGVNPAVAVKAPPTYALPAGPPKWS